MTKSEQRKYIRDKVNGLKAEQIAEKSEIICDKVINAGFIKQGMKVLLYSALPHEVNADKLVSYAREVGADVYLPRVSGKVIKAVKLDSDSPMNVGAYGILEPVGEPYNGGMDVVIIPMEAGDRECNRLGKGGGYYDRYLAVSVLKIGIMFSCQKVDKVVTEAHDTAMDYIVTEDEIYARCRR